MITHRFQRVRYRGLNAREQEAYNFQKISSVLADYGFVTIRLSSDWRGADFIAQHFDGSTFIKVQLKGRFTVDKKYLDRDLHIGFHDGDHWYLYPHDELLKKILESTRISNTESWLKHGSYHFPRLTKKLHALLESYILKGQTGCSPPRSTRTNVLDLRRQEC